MYLLSFHCLFVLLLYIPVNNQSKMYIVGTLKDHLNETILLSTQNIC